VSEADDRLDVSLDMAADSIGPGLPGIIRSGGYAVGRLKTSEAGFMRRSKENLILS
jgi:hypothetical protein